MTRLRVAAVLGVVVGVLLLLLANDVRSWRSVLAHDALVSYVAPTTPPRLDPGTALPSGLSGSLLGVGRDRDWLRAVRSFDVAYGTTVRKNQLGEDDYRLLNGAERALGKVTQDPSPALASQAYNLLAVVVFREAYPGTVVVRRLVEESLTDEQNAVRLDPANEPAKENLELTLRVLVSVGLPPQQARASGTRRSPQKKGGYEGPPGAGY